MHTRRGSQKRARSWPFSAAVCNSISPINPSATSLHPPLPPTTIRSSPSTITTALHSCLAGPSYLPLHRYPSMAALDEQVRASELAQNAIRSLKTGNAEVRSWLSLFFRARILPVLFGVFISPHSSLAAYRRTLSRARIPGWCPRRALAPAQFPSYLLHRAALPPAPAPHACLTNVSLFGRFGIGCGTCHQRSALPGAG